LANRVELSLLGQSLTVRTEAAPEHVRALARYLEDRVEVLRRSGVQDPTKALLLAALDITDELFRARDEGGRAGELGDRLGALVALLERAMPPDV
jgi:cell division protein ZapA (FtsZ GTPase activity inhibitor)